MTVMLLQNVKSHEKNWKIILYQLSKNSSGFTLIDLLAAIVITGILAAGTSVGLTTILQKNQKEEEQILRRQESNRALNFIAEEIKSAQEISTDPSITDNDGNPNNDAPSGSTLSSGTNVETVLTLIIPGLADPVVYRSAKPPSNSVWQGPRVIYRWGPNLKQDGSYSDPGDSKNWHNRALIDLVTDNTDNNLPDYCSQSGVTQIPSSAKGFYICVQDDSPSRVAELVIRSQLKNQSSDDDKQYIETSIRTFARSN